MDTQHATVSPGSDVVGGVDAGAPTPRRTGPHLDRIAVGLLLVALGAGWVVAGLGLPVPWHLLPSAALVVVGLLLLAGARTGRGIGASVGLGVPILLIAVAVGVGGDGFLGPVGDRTVAPGRDAWPVTEQIGAGTVTVDLVAHPLPAAGRLSVSVGAGRVVLLLPAAAPHVDAATAAGSITVNGRRIADGLDVRWSEPQPEAAPVVEVRVSAGDVEVHHG